MHRLYLILKDRYQPPTEEEKDIAAAKKTIDAARAGARRARESLVNYFQSFQSAIPAGRGMFLFGSAFYSLFYS